MHVCLFLMTTMPLHHESERNWSSPPTAPALDCLKVRRDFETSVLGGSRDLRRMNSFLIRPAYTNITSQAEAATTKATDAVIEPSSVCFRVLPRLPCWAINIIHFGRSIEWLAFSEIGR